MIDNPVLAPITNPALQLTGLRHGFFTREGGVSSGLYGTLNAGPGSNDVPSLVAQNRHRIALQMAVAPNHLLSPYQFHSCEVVAVVEPFGAERPRADAIVTATRGLAIGVVTADCGPVLFADAVAGVVGAAHAGWQGATGGVLENTIAAMENLSATRANIVAVLGPTISQQNYEVGLDFEEKLLAKDPDGFAFFVSGQNSDKRQFDLPGYILMRLRRAGVAGFDTKQCTYAHSDRFFSFRRTTHKNEPDYGRQMSAICLE